MNYTEITIELLLFSICLSIYINSLHLAFQKDMILERLHIWLDKKFSNKLWRKWLGKPLFICATCMSSIHSLPLLLILPLWKVAIIAVISVTISTLINDKIYN